MSMISEVLCVADLPCLLLIFTGCQANNKPGKVQNANVKHQKVTSQKARWKISRWLEPMVFGPIFSPHR